jgi:hypothetical protein
MIVPASDAAPQTHAPYFPSAPQRWAPLPPFVHAQAIV